MKTGFDQKIFWRKKNSKFYLKTEKSRNSKRETKLFYKHREKKWNKFYSQFRTNTL